MNYKNGAFLEFVKASKEYFTILSVLTVLIGGLSQFIELFSLSPSFVRFYSITQLISDGLAFFVFLFLLFTPWAIVIFFFTVKREKSKKQEATTLGLPKLIIFTIILCISIYGGLDWSKEFVNWNDFINPESHNWGNFYNGYLIISLGSVYIILAAIGFITTVQELTKKFDLIKRLFRTKIVSGLAFVLCIILFLVLIGTVTKLGEVAYTKLVTLKNEFLIPSEFLNSKELIKRFTSQYPKKEIKVEYFNDKYVFVKIGDKIKVLKIDTLIQ